MSYVSSFASKIRWVVLHSLFSFDLRFAWKDSPEITRWSFDWWSYGEFIISFRGKKYYRKSYQWLFGKGQNSLLYSTKTLTEKIWPLSYRRSVEGFGRNNRESRNIQEDPTKKMWESCSERSLSEEDSLRAQWSVSASSINNWWITFFLWWYRCFEAHNIATSYL